MQQCAIYRESAELIEVQNKGKGYTASNRNICLLEVHIWRYVSRPAHGNAMHKKPKAMLRIVKSDVILVERSSKCRQRKSFSSID